jgi:hypothetical protein
MLEKEAIQQRGFRNIIEGGRVAGYQFLVRSLYYRGLWLSQITGFTLRVDGKEADNQSVSFTVKGNTYSLSEMKTIGDVLWGVTEPLKVTVKQDGGLASGFHTLELDIMHSSSYMPPNMDFVLSTRGQKRELILV